jgi:hypothetical protein
MVGFTPRAMRVERLLGEHGIGQDFAAGRREFERQMERRRLEAIEEEALKPLRRGWQESEWAARRRSDPGKLAIAARLRCESTLPINWIAARVQIGTANGAKALLHHLAQSQDKRKTASALEPFAQLEFQSAAGPLSMGPRTASGGCAGENGLPGAPLARQPCHH